MYCFEVAKHEQGGCSEVGVVDAEFWTTVAADHCGQWIGYETETADPLERIQLVTRACSARCHSGETLDICSVEHQHHGC